MKYFISLILFFLLVSAGFAQPDKNKKITINKLEDFFRFENVQQLESYFGGKNVFTENTFYGNPNQGSKPYLVSQVKFDTPQSVLIIWNGAGNVVCEVQTSAFYYDFVTKKLKEIPNTWKTKQGVSAGMRLNNLVRLNWWPLSFYTQDVEPYGKAGNIILKTGMLRSEIRVPFSNQKLIYEYMLDTEYIKEFISDVTTPVMKSNTNSVKKWNPILGLISIYREGLKPEK